MSESIHISGDDGVGKDFEQLITSHQHPLYVFIRSMVFNLADARDILQDVSIILIRKKDAFAPGTNFKAWAFTIARYECLSYLRRYKQSKLTTLDTGMLESLADVAEEDSDEMNDWLTALRQCVRGLPEEGRQMIQARYHDRTPLETSAAQQQTSTPAYKQKLYRVRNGLRKCILERLGKKPLDGGK